ncbi:MAG: efflux RND transporter periplasmic adaptor subunit [Rhodocyclaceae bacterium]|nr:efflux RND transporter periplasmic adaptor subunit [Rhodocyclaceae bacterium]
MTISNHSSSRRPLPFLRWLLILAALAALGSWLWPTSPDNAAKVAKADSAVSVTSALVATKAMPIKLKASATVAAVQSVEIRAQISATIRQVHIKEGQTVRKGERLFSLDVRNEDANVAKFEAQVAKSAADLANAERTLTRQRELFAQKFIAQTALDAAQNQVDSLRAQAAADRASLAASKVARSYGEIVAPIAGRTGAISVYPGTLVQPSGAALVSIAQVNPINVNFTIAERELAAVRSAFDRGPVPVSVSREKAGTPALQGTLSFIDNAVDLASGTIRLKALFSNAEGQLWPGMFVDAELIPRVIDNALVVPAQAVQTGPEKRFVYVIAEDGSVAAKPVIVLLVQDGEAAIEGVPAGTKVVVEGAQNLRPNSTVVVAP